MNDDNIFRLNCRLRNENISNYIKNTGKFKYTCLKMTQLDLNVRKIVWFGHLNNMVLYITHGQMIKGRFLLFRVALL